MHEDSLFDERLFPPSDDFDNTFEFGNAVAKAIFDKFRRNRGGEPAELLSNNVETFGQLYAHAEKYDKLVLTPDDLDYFTVSVLEDASDSTVISNARQLGERLEAIGWHEVDTSFCFPGSKWGDFDYVYVRPHWELGGDSIVPTIRTLKESTENELIFSTTTIRDFVRDFLTESEKGGSVDDEDVEAYLALVETRLDDSSWIFLEALDSSFRLWMEPKECISTLIKEFEGQSEIPYEGLRNHLFEFIHHNSPKIAANAEIDARPFIDKFEKRIREREWVPVHREGQTTWYRTDKGQREALEKFIDRYGDVIEHPVPPNWREQSDDYWGTFDLREDAYEFFSKNTYAISQHGFYERDHLADQLRKLEYSIEADEDIQRMDGSETKGGIWTIDISVDSSEMTRDDEESEEEPK